MIEQRQLNGWVAQLEKFAHLYADDKIALALKEKGYWQKRDKIVQHWQLLGEAEAYDEREKLIEELRVLNLEYAHIQHLVS